MVLPRIDELSIAAKKTFSAVVFTGRIAQAAAGFTISQ